MKFIPIAMLFALIGYSESLTMNTETLSHKEHWVPPQNRPTDPHHSKRRRHMTSGPMAPKMAPGDIPGTGSMPSGYGGQSAHSQGSGPMNPGQGQAPGMGPSPPNYTSTSDAPGYPGY